MEVILLEDVRNLGSLGSKVKVKRGYGRNFLIPQGKAVPATKENVVKFEERRAELEKVAKEKLATSEKRKEQLEELSVVISAKSGDEGKLFGSIGTRDIAEAITAAGVDVVKAEVLLPQGTIRVTGDYEIELQLHTEVVATVKLAIVSEQ